MHWMRAGSWVGVLGLVACSSEPRGTPVSVEHCLSTDGTCYRGSGGAGGLRGAGGSDGGSAGTPLTFARSSLARQNPLLATPDALANTVEDGAAFGFELEQKLSQSRGNVFFSPLSLETAMAMAWAGAKGATATEIATVFHFGDPAAVHGGLGALDAATTIDESDLVFSSANAFFVSKTITPRDEYLNVLGLDYGAGVGLVDFDDPATAAAQIDGWVSAQTHGAIPELLLASDLPKFWTVSVLTNAAYFEANWAEPFDPDATHAGVFTGDDGKSAEVKFMSAEPTIPYVETADYKAASLAYAGREGHHFEMVVVLPSGPIGDLEKTLGAPWFSALRASLAPTFIDLEVPRFEIRTPLRLKDTLSAMGMPTAFDPAKGDFSGIGAGRLHLLNVVHEGFLSVNEVGTEASAATAVIVGKDGGIGPVQTPTATFHLDRPFLVMIRHVETNALLFAGRVAEL